ncbi:hypothetical protein NA57DRAFT_52683 [Rhizodiscina lignyota]|uniref:Uncharacterized protein n=1 Tax=Rhizodiscina lignyota TaxID=1504668 RepID=A0A9P4M9T3_9PEZI|nr:hypothetical protein NA57DRAFT_52683 [Rhizodiscina lignyota]
MASQSSNALRRKRRSSAVAERDNNKRTKRTSTPNVQQLQAEREQSENPGPVASQDTIEMTENELNSSIEVAQQANNDRSKHVRFAGQTPSTHAEHPPTPPDTVSPAIPNDTGLTPYIQRTSLSPHPQSSSHRRRSSMTPIIRDTPDGTVVAEVQFSPLSQVINERSRRRLRRSHLSEEVNDIEEHKKEDAKTRQELEELKKQMQEKNKRMKELEWELESQRQMGIDISQASEEEQRKNREMQEELKKLEQEVEEHKHAHDVSMRDDDDLVLFENTVEAPDSREATAIVTNEENDTTLIDPGDTEVSTGSVTPAIKLPSSFVTEQALYAVHDPTREAEVQRFEEVTTHLNHDLAAARAELQILTTELQTLGFSGLNSGTENVLTNLRAAFHDARYQLNHMLPEAEGHKFENAQFLKLLVDNIHSLRLKVEDQKEMIRKADETELVMKEQHSNLLEQFTESEQRKRHLEKQWNRMDLLAEERGKKIVDFEDELSEWKEGCDERDKIIADDDQRIAELEEDVEMRDQDKERLQNAINSYRKELDQAEALLHKVEEEYKQHVATMEMEHAQTVLDLGAQIRDINDAKITAEKDVEAKGTRITHLEDEISRATNDIDDLKTQLAASQEEVTTQRSQREMAELEIDEKQSFITGLELRLESAEENLDDLKAQLEQVGSIADSERHQREAAEVELDNRNTDVEILDERIKKAGIEANVIKSKLFEVQQRREKEVAELTAAAAGREAILSAELDGERDARAAAEERVEELNDVIADMEEKIRATEDTMEQLLAEKDEIIADREGRIQELEGEAIEDAEKNEATIAAKDEAIEELNDNLDSKKQELEALQQLKQSLERRIEDEAAAMLEAENAHNDTIAGLNSSLNARDREIGKLLLEQEDAEKRYAEVMHGKNEKIEDLELLAESRLGDINNLHVQVNDLKDKLSQSVRMSRETVDRINKRMATALADSQNEQRELVDEGDRLMTDAGSQILMVDGAADAEELKPLPTRSTRATVRKRKRDHDSGIGLDRSSEEEDEESMVEDMSPFLTASAL